MSGSLNKCQLIGRIGKDPDVRFTNDNKPIANLTLATSEKWKSQSGEAQEKTEWHRVVVFGNLAGIVQQYVKKGDQIYFEGKLQTRKWTDKQDTERFTTEVVIDRGGNMVMLGGGNNASPSEPSKPAQQENTSEMEDDLPF